MTNVIEEKQCVICDKETSNVIAITSVCGKINLPVCTGEHENEALRELKEDQIITK